MTLTELDNNISISIYDNFYLICNSYNPTNYHYYLGYVKDNNIKFTQGLRLITSPTAFKDILDDDKYNGVAKLSKKGKKKQAEKDLIFLHSQIESRINGNDDADNILIELVGTLGDIAEEIKGTGKSTINADNLHSITNETVINKLFKLDDEIKADKNSKIYLANDETKGDIVQFTNNPAHKDGLYYEKTYKNKKGDYETSYKLIGNLLIHNLTLTYDKLGLFNPVTTIQYTNTAINQLITLEKQPYEAIAKNLINNRVIDSTEEGIKSLLGRINVQGVNNTDIVTAEMDLLKDGFFMDMKNNKVVSNNVFENLETTPNDVAEAIKLFNELIANRGTAIPNDCTLFRFMLWSPFAYCLKQMGFTDGLYSMVLWGVTDTNKTGSSVMLSNLYTDKATTLQKANTQSAIGTRLGENTFPLILDEAKDNLINPNDEEFNKNIVTDKIGRAVKDRTNNNLMEEFPALRLTVRTLNPKVEFKAEFLKRHKVLQYDGSMQVKEADKLEFNKKFKPNAPNTPLKQLRHLGKAFADKFIPYLESQSDKLYNLEDLTISILSEIQKECNTQFNTNVMIKQKLTAQSTDDASKIKNDLNNMFTKAYKLPYGHTGYMATDFENAVKMGAIRWLDYQPKNELFIIKVADFETDISNIVGQYIPIAETMKLLNIEYDNNNGKKVKFRGNAYECIKLNLYNLSYKLFGINIYGFEELEQLQAEEEERKQRETKADEMQTE